MKNRYTYEQCKDALEKLKKYMELLNDQMAYTKDEIDWYSKHYQKVAEERIKSGKLANYNLLIEAQQSIIYFTKEEFQNE